MAVLMLALAAPARAASLDNAQTFSFFFENDFYFTADDGTTSDRWNTADLKAAWISAPLGGLGDYLDNPERERHQLVRLPWQKGEGAFRTLGVSVWSAIRTPEDLDASEVVEDDRPYAGYLGLAVAVNSVSQTQLDTLELTVGIVGPSSFAEELQNAFHDRDASGWGNQLAGEVAFVLAWQRFHRAATWDLGRGVGAEIIPHYGLAAGTLFVYANAGAEARIGHRLPSDFGTPIVRPANGIQGPTTPDDPRLTEHDRSRVGAYAFVSADVRAVAHNLFLDGSTFEDSHSIDKQPVVADLAGGVAVYWRKARFSFAPVLRTKEFDGQPEHQLFASANLSITF
jgi:hypothetical protein